MATLDIPTSYLALAPIVVTSPTTRCGTTLVQRLLSSSDNAFIYGEDIGNQLRILTSLFIAQIGHLERNGDALDAAFLDALAGTLDQWQPGLAPPASIMLRAWTETYYRLPATLEAVGRSLNRPLWGFKWPGYSLDALRMLRALMPQTRVIYAMRNVVDALRSAKARRFVTDEAGAERFCAEWASNMQAFAGLRDDRVLHLRYEALATEGPAQVAALAAFTGASGIQLGQLDVKVNTFEGPETHGLSPTQYIAPEPLTRDDWAAVVGQAGAVMAEHYPNIALQAAA